MLKSGDEGEMIKEKISIEQIRAIIEKETPASLSFRKQVQTEKVKNSTCFIIATIVEKYNIKTQKEFLNLLNVNRSSFVQWRHQSFHRAMIHRIRQKVIQFQFVSYDPILRKLFIIRHDLAIVFI